MIHPAAAALPPTVSDTANVPTVQSKIVDSTTQNFSTPNVSMQTSKASPPCDECGATIA